MDISAFVAPFTRPAAIIAALAGTIVLSFVFATVSRARTRRARRLAAEKRCRELVGLMRRCPKLRRPQDRRLAEKFAPELETIMAANAFAFHQVGTSRAEIDRILFLVREEVKDFMSIQRLAGGVARTPGTPDPRTAIVLPAEFPKQEPQILFEATFTEADLAGAADPKSGVVEAPAQPATAYGGDPIKALRTVGDEEIDSYVDDRFAAITSQE